MKKKVKVIKKKKVTPKATKKSVKVVSPNELALPLQSKEELQLVDTNNSIILGLSKPNLFREELLKTKQQFVERVEELSLACGVRCDVRVYFTFTALGKKED